MISDICRVSVSGLDWWCVCLMWRRLLAMTREAKMKELQMLDSARRKFMNYTQQQKETELARLDDEIRRKVRHLLMMMMMTMFLVSHACWHKYNHFSLLCISCFLLCLCLMLSFSSFLASFILFFFVFFCSYSFWLYCKPKQVWQFSEL